ADPATQRLRLVRARRAWHLRTYRRRRGGAEPFRPCHRRARRANRDKSASHQAFSMRVSYAKFAEPPRPAPVLTSSRGGTNKDSFAKQKARTTGLRDRSFDLSKEH